MKRYGRAADLVLVGQLLHGDAQFVLGDQFAYINFTQSMIPLSRYQKNDEIFSEGLEALCRIHSVLLRM